MLGDLKAEKRKGVLEEVAWLSSCRLDSRPDLTVNPMASRLKTKARRKYRRRSTVQATRNSCRVALGIVHSSRQSSKFRSFNPSDVPQRRPQNSTANNRRQTLDMHSA